MQVRLAVCYSKYNLIINCIMTGCLCVRVPANACERTAGPKKVAAAREPAPTSFERARHPMSVIIHAGKHVSPSHCPTLLLLFCINTHTHTTHTRTRLRKRFVCVPQLTGLTGKSVRAHSVVTHSMRSHMIVLLCRANCANSQLKHTNQQPHISILL